MSDDEIAARLRNVADVEPFAPLCHKAAAEIERLRAELAAEREANEALRLTITAETELQSQLQAELAAEREKFETLHAAWTKERNKPVQFVGSAERDELRALLRECRSGWYLNEELNARIAAALKGGGDE